MTATVTDLRTLPEWALHMGLPVDRLREMLRRQPNLKALGRRIGATTIYSQDAAEQIRAAFRARITPVTSAG